MDSDSMRTLCTGVTVYWLFSHVTTWSRCPNTYSICPPPKKVMSSSPQKKMKMQNNK
ncbi:hypothetical protein L208DRAFT_849170 [Tricholoma matsutake]|nr:hypothetical protein L208DRAFT_849170 [Tricholoma matsutake 945]